MGQKTGYNWVKYIFFAFNVFIWLLGCGVLSLGLWLQINRGPYISIVPAQSFFGASALCITAGALILLVGFLGCCGAFYENQCMLIGYFIMVLLIFSLEITAGTLAFIHKDDLRTAIQKDLLLSIRREYRIGAEAEKAAQDAPENLSSDPEQWWLLMDSLQAELHCCGVNNYSDWFNIRAWPSEKRVPNSCCKQPEDGCGQLDTRYWFERGCMSEVDYWFVNNMYILGVVGIAVAVVQILGMIAAIILFCYIRNHKFFL